MNNGDQKTRMASPLRHLAVKLRQHATCVEAILWKRLRARQVDGVKFRRQQPIGNFIVDFVSFEKRIIIELDGGQHAEDASGDIERDELLSQRGFTVLRFWNNEVLDNLDGVLEVIRNACLK